MRACAPTGLSGLDHRRLVWAIKAALVPGAAWSHASEQSLVLLLPTDIYITAGVTAVAATVVLIALVPPSWALGLFRPWRIRLPKVSPLATSTGAAVFLALLLWAGLAGPRDPLANPLPLVVWTVWWVGLLTLQGLIGGLWHWLNPWSGPVALARHGLGVAPVAHWPSWLGHSAGILGFFAFAYVLLVDPAPSDPARLAGFVGLYWLVIFLGGLIFGPRFLRRADGVSLVFETMGRLGLLTRRGLGLWGWQLLGRPWPMGLALMAVILLGTGSFDGLNETFWWLGLLNVNPFEFPGRSGLIWPTLAGLILANLALVAVLWAAIWAGLRLARAPMGPGLGFRIFAPSVLPIALGYHVAHYFTSFLVDGQYALVALSDPFLTGADYLGLGAHYVSTGFFNTTGTVRVIFLTQAGAVVAGHVVAVLLAHALALRTFGEPRRAALSQAPLAVFMVGYTLVGLWLLATPRI